MTHSCRVSFAILNKKENNILLTVGLVEKDRLFNFLRKV